MAEPMWESGNVCKAQPRIAGTAMHDRKFPRLPLLPVLSSLNSCHSKASASAPPNVFMPAMLKLLPALNGSGEGNIIGVFKLGAEGKPTGKAGNLDAERGNLLA